MIRKKLRNYEITKLLNRLSNSVIQRFSHSARASRRAYTLIELLVSVLIFSGLIVLAIAAFARSVSSSSQSNVVRAQVQAARSVTDQLTNDLHYVDTVDQPASLKSSCGSPASIFTGVRLGNAFGCDEAELLLKYPGATGAGDLVWRLYAAQTLNNRPSVYVYELRGLSVCTPLGGGNPVVASQTAPCAAASPPATPADLLSSAYVADGLGGLTPVFSGLDIAAAKSATASPYVKIHFDLKPAGDAAQTCATLGAGTCYTLDTTVVPGAI
ncbi:MAG TPA: type II secretion system protein [Candidatus Saccharimonadales bacterium]|nr:type II secretion system protein [Candidatus Saccharimonadales bacterium]